MRGTSPALSMSEVRDPTDGQATHIDSNDDAQKSSIDAGDDRGQPLLARAPVPCDRLSAMVPPKADCVLSLLPHAESPAIWLRWNMHLVERILR